MNTLDKLVYQMEAIEEKLHYRFQDRRLGMLSFVHRSYLNEHREVHEHNERLEFLGDSILGLLIADHLYRMLPSTPEGELSAYRSRLVEAQSCIFYVQKLGVEEYLLLGKGEQMNDGRGRDSILADLFEAIIGAIYLDGGFSSVQQFFFFHFIEDVNKILQSPLKNWKALLQDYCQKKYQMTPVYTVVSESGPDHNKIFIISVGIRGQEMGTGQGASKKEAQQQAAKDAFLRVEGQMAGIESV